MNTNDVVTKPDHPILPPPTPPVWFVWVLLLAGLGMTVLGVVLPAGWSKQVVIILLGMLITVETVAWMAGRLNR